MPSTTSLRFLWWLSTTVVPSWSWSHVVTTAPPLAATATALRASLSTDDFQDYENNLVNIKQNSNNNLNDVVKSVNYFISRRCNYSCKFCFHTQKTSHHLSIEQSKLGLRLLAEAGTEKINFARGEPFLHSELLGELCRTASHDLGLTVSIISNGSLIDATWMREYGKYVDVLGLSVDSFDDATNAAIGRGETLSSTTSVSVPPRQKQNRHVDRVLRVRELCAQHDIVFKLNTVVCSLNWEENMNDHVKRLDPMRWKVFQVLLLQDENVGAPGNLRDARGLVVTDDQFDAFVRRHRPNIPQCIPEPNDVMQNSYLLLDENMAFLDCSGGGKVPGQSILTVGVEKALQQAGFDHSMFHQRGGVYDWRRERETRN